MIHRFEDLKQLYKEAASIRYVGGGTAADAEVDGLDESDRATSSLPLPLKTR